MGYELRALVVGSGFEPLKAKPVDLPPPSSAKEPDNRASYPDPM